MPPVIVRPDALQAVAGQAAGLVSQADAVIGATGSAGGQMGSGAVSSSVAELHLSWQRWSGDIAVLLAGSGQYLNTVAATFSATDDQLAGLL